MSLNNVEGVRGNGTVVSEFLITWKAYEETEQW